jgi:AGCS family alanine or glycine:cation symporter
VFWLWISALVGMVTKYSEVVLAVKFRERNEAGDWVGGPMYYIKNGLGKSWMWLAFVFAFSGMTASFGIGNTTQVDSIATAIGTAVSAFGGGEVSTTFRIIIGVIVAIITAFVIIGGIKRIGSVT